MPSARGLLVGVTGIDGSGKGYVTERLVALLEERGVRVAVINIDGWLNLPDQRFGRDNPAEHFYEHGLRLDEMFERLVLPLRDRRTLRVEAELADATNTTNFRRHTYELVDVAVILLEGIFLLKRACRSHFDLTFWVDCTFETALERALARGQEGLPPDEALRDYQTIYFPAQQLHMTRDWPRAAASAIIPNDPRISRPSV